MSDDVLAPPVPVVAPPYHSPEREELQARARRHQAHEKRSAGLATLLVEKERDAFPDGITGRPIDKIGYHGFVTWDLRPTGSGRPGSPTPRNGSTSPACTPPPAVGLARAAVEDCIG